MLTMRVYSTIPNFLEWMIINFVNVVGGSLLGFYIFRGECLIENYIKLCKPCTCMAMQKKAWMNFFLFKEFLSFFKQFVPIGVSTTNQHILIVDSYGSHVTLKVVEQAHKFGLDMIILLTHTFHAL